MAENNDKRPDVNNNTKLFITSVILCLCVIVFLSVYFLNRFVMKIDEWWILLLMSINIIFTIATEMFRFDDSTGGYQNLLDTLQIIAFVLVTLLTIVLKQNNVLFITNKDLLVFGLIFYLILMIIKNVVRNYLSEKNERLNF